MFQSVLLYACLQCICPSFSLSDCMPIFQCVLNMYTRLSSTHFSLSDCSCLPIFQSVLLYTWLQYICPSFSLSYCIPDYSVSAHLSVCLTVCRTACPSISLCDSMPDCLPIFQSVLLYAWLQCICPSFRLSDCMPDCLPNF